MKEYNYNLIPERVDFNISTIGLKVLYTERETSIEFEGQILADYKKNNTLYNVFVKFNTVAEVKCITLNFFEQNYTNHKVFKINEDLSKLDFWKKFGYCPNSGFYQVDDSEWLKEKKRLYDPTNTLNLNHYLIVGYDSYIEILANRYSYSISNVTVI